MNLQVHTSSRRELVDITDEVQSQLRPGTAGVVVITVLHTTAAVTTIDSDPGIDQDLFDFLEGITPSVHWRHPHNPAHAPDHLLASIIGPSITLPLHDGRLVLGTWQRVVLIEFGGPRPRDLNLTVLSLEN